MYGYKVLEQMDDKLISPLYRSEWVFGNKSIAACGFVAHAAPDPECRCGIYATKEVLACSPYIRGVPSIIALGWGSGKTIIGDGGYRCAEWEPVYMVDISAIEDESDLMWEAAQRSTDGGVETTLYILGLEKAQQRSKEVFAANRKLREELHVRLGVPVIDLFQAEALIGDSWGK